MKYEQKPGAAVAAALRLYFPSTFGYDDLEDAEDQNPFLAINDKTTGKSSEQTDAEAARDNAAKEAAEQLTGKPPAGSPAADEEDSSAQNLGANSAVAKRERDTLAALALIGKTSNWQTKDLVDNDALCHAPEALKSAGQFCDPDWLLKQQDLSELGTQLHTLASARIRTACAGAQPVRLGVLVIGPGSKEDPGVVSEHMYNMWPLDHRSMAARLKHECDASLLLSAQQSVNGSLWLNARLGPAVRAHVLPLVSTKLGDYAIKLTQGVELRFRLAAALRTYAELLQLEMRNFVAPPREPKQLYALATIFATCTVLFSAVIGAVLVSIVRQHRKPRTEIVPMANIDELYFS